MGEVRERRSTWSRTMAMGPYQMLLDAGQNGVLGGDPEDQQQGHQQQQEQRQRQEACVGMVGMRRYEGGRARLPCCGCGVGWGCFVMGFVLPVFWYYAAFVFLAHDCQTNPRERPGLAACTIAALVNSVALAMALLALLLQHHGFFQSPSSPSPSPLQSPFP